MIELYKRVLIQKDIPIIGTLIDYISHPREGEIGCIVETNELIEVIPYSQIQLYED